MKKILFLICALFSMNAFAISIPITEGMLNAQVSNSFPKTIKKVELSNPQITLMNGKSILCMDGIPRVMFLEKAFKTCASFKPVWNEKESRLEATNLEILDLEVKDVGSLPPALKFLVTEVISGIEPLVLYKADSWLFKQISAIEIEKNMIYLKF